MKRLFVAAILTGLLPAVAQEGTDAALVRARRFASAHKEGNEEAMRRIAASGDVDPWVVGWEIGRLASRDIALAFAEHVPKSKSVERLAEYLRGHTEPFRGGSPRDAFEEARTLFSLALRRAQSRSTSPAELRSIEDLFASAADRARLVGWMDGECLALAWAGEIANRDYAADRTRRHWELLYSANVRRGRPVDARTTLHNLAVLEAMSGRLEPAAVRMTELIAQIVDAPDGEARQERARRERQIVFLRRQMCVLRRMQGRYADALHQIALARPLAERAGMGLDFRKLQADVLAVSGSFADAERVYGETLARAKAEGNERLLYEVLVDHAECLGYQGKHLAALERLAQTSALRRTHPAGYANAALNIALNSGWYTARVGRDEEALVFYREALGLAERRHDASMQALALINIASSLTALGRRGEAREAIESAAEHAEQAESFDVDVELLRARADLELAEGHTDAAFEGVTAAIDLIRRRLGGLSTIEGARAASRRHDLFRQALTIAVASKRPDAVSRVMESSRAGALLSAITHRTVRNAALPESAILDVEERKHAAVSEAEGLFQRAVAEASGREATSDALARVRSTRATLRLARSEHELAIRDVERESHRGGQLVYPQVAPLTDLQARVRPNLAMVLFDLNGPRATALVVESKTARVVDLGETAAIDALVARLYADSNATSAREADCVEAHRRIVEPLGLSKSTTRLLVSPDGSLFRLPFACVTDREVSYVPSGTVYLGLLSAREKRGERVLAIGDPAYPSDSEFTRLPASAAEARAIGDVTLLDKDATRARFLIEVAKRPRWRALHFACHGRIDPDRPMRAALQLADGPFEAPEIYATRIPADLVVLSACDTGGGTVLRGEGLIGFSRAFMYAGSPRVIVSLWAVDDAATRELMTKFYELWNPNEGVGVPAVTALRRAQAHVASISKWEHPTYWASWQLWGLPD